MNVSEQQVAEKKEIYNLADVERKMGEYKNALSVFRRPTIEQFNADFMLFQISIVAWYMRCWVAEKTDAGVVVDSTSLLKEEEAFIHAFSQQSTTDEGALRRIGRRVAGGDDELFSLFQENVTGDKKMSSKEIRDIITKEGARSH